MIKAIRFQILRGATKPSSNGTSKPRDFQSSCQLHRCPPQNHGHHLLTSVTIYIAQLASSKDFQPLGRPSTSPAGYQIASPTLFPRSTSNPKVEFTVPALQIWEPQIGRRYDFRPMSEALGEFATQVIGRSVVSVAIVIIDRQVDQRREIITRKTRQLQDLLRMPECLRIITDTDPGMPDDEIRLSLQFLGFSCLLSDFGLA